MQCKIKGKCEKCEQGYDVDNDVCIASGGSGSSLGLILGIVFGVIFLIVFFIGGAYKYKNKGRKKQSLLEADADREEEGEETKIWSYQLLKLYF